MNPLDAYSYNAEVAQLVGRKPLNDLGPGTPDRERFPQLGALSPERLVAPRPVRDRSMAEACLAGMWLLYDHLDESHNISQSLPTAEGSYWHGILHRREPDYDNAKYWFHRVPSHPIHEVLNAEARRLALASPVDPAADFLRNQNEWDAFSFVDLCQAVALGSSESGELCRHVQQREWELLFAYCWRKAGGESA